MSNNRTKNNNNNTHTQKKKKKETQKFFYIVERLHTAAHTTMSRCYRQEGKRESEHYFSHRTHTHTQREVRIGIRSPRIGCLSLGVHRVRLYHPVTMQLPAPRTPDGPNATVCVAVHVHQLPVRVHPEQPSVAMTAIVRPALQ